MPLRGDILDPIAGGNPAGVPLRHEPVFSQIREARRSDDDGSRRPEDGPAKVADWAKVTELSSTALATQSKDLELAGWLTESLLRREGFGGLRAGLDLLRELIARYWDTLYPPLDPEDDPPTAQRAARLSWVGQYLVRAVADTPITRKGHTLLKYRESRAVGSEADCAGDNKKLEQRQALIDEGKIPAEEFDRGVLESTKVWYKALLTDLKAASASVSALNALSRERMPDDPPDFSPLRDALADVERVVAPIVAQKLQLEPDPVDLSVPESSGAADDQDGVPIEPRNMDDAAARLAATARYLRAQLPGNPGPYLMLRGLRWGELRAYNGDVDPKALVAPPTHLRSQLKGLLLDGRWNELLEACETVMTRPEGRGWLDLQRYAVTACDNLGGDFETVARAIRAELALLLRDLPALPDLALMDDTGTANTETRQWLRGEQLLPRADDGQVVADDEGASTPRTPIRSRLQSDAVYERARDAARSGQVKRAIEMLSAEVERERSTRGRFLRRAQIASLMLDGGLDAPAQPILEELIGQIDAHNLEQWEAGDVVAQPLTLLFQCLTKLDLDADRRQEIYLRVARLDPLQAMNLAG